MEKLNDASINDWLSEQDGWERDGDMITKEFNFDSFRDGIVFVNRVATVADEMNHHPDIDIRYTTITIAMTTHDAGGLTEKDLELAQQVDHATSR